MALWGLTRSGREHHYGSSMDIRGARVVVTGAGGGLGAAVVERLSSAGAEVVGVDVVGTPEVLDVTDAAACRALAQRLQPDVWVNNAGVLGNGVAADQPDEVVRQTIEVNLLGVINGSRAAAEVMRPRGRGVIVNIGSLASWVPVPGETVYAATKHGVRAFSQGLAVELAPSGVKVCTVCPDGIWSPMVADKLADPSAALSFTGRRLLFPAEVADVVARVIERPRAVTDVPRGRGIFMRVMSVTPGALGRFGKVFVRIGRRNQMRLATKVRAGTLAPPR